MSTLRFDSRTTPARSTSTSQEVRPTGSNTARAPTSTAAQGAAVKKGQDSFTVQTRAPVSLTPPPVVAAKIGVEQLDELKAPRPLGGERTGQAEPTYASTALQSLGLEPGGSLGVRPGDLVASALPGEGMLVAEAVQVSGPNATTEEVINQAMKQFGLVPTRPGQTPEFILKPRLNSNGSPVIQNQGGRYYADVVPVPYAASPKVNVEAPRQEYQAHAQRLREVTQSWVSNIQRGGYYEGNELKNFLAPYVAHGFISQADANTLVNFNNESKQTHQNVEDQLGLKDLGYYTGKLDGKVGQGTTDATKAFQLNNGLYPDGIIGDETRRVMSDPNAITRAQAQGYQQSLQQLGFYSGQADGVMATSTRAAIANFQAANGLRTDGIIGKQTEAALRDPGAVTGPQVRTAQSRLQELGYYGGKVDGVWGEGSQRAFRDYQQATGQQATGRLSGQGLTALQRPDAPLSPKHPALQTVPERVFNFFKGFGLEALDTVKGLGDTAKLLNDANPLLQATGALADLIVSPITGKSPGEIVTERTERFKQAGSILLQQGAGLLKLASDLSGPAQVTNFAKMSDAMVRDMMALHEDGKLTPGAVADVIAQRTGQNPSLQAAATVVDAFTNYKAILSSGGDPEQIGRGAFRIFETLSSFAKPSAKGVKATIPQQALSSAPLSQAQRSVLDALPSPGSRVEVPRAGFSLNDLAKVTQESGREFAVLTRGDQRLVIAGDATSVPLGPEEMKKLSDEGWKLTAHSHVEGLTPSLGDSNVVSAGGHKRSIIVDSENGRVSFTPEEGVGGAPGSLSAGMTQQQARKLIGSLTPDEQAFLGKVANGENPSSLIADSNELTRTVNTINRKLKQPNLESSAQVARTSELFKPAAAAAAVAVRVSDMTPYNLGDKLEEFAQQLKQKSTHDIAPGGAITLTAPPVQGRNNVLPAKSLELTFNPEDLYVHDMKVGDVTVSIGKGGERYPTGPRVVLNPEEINTLVRNFNEYVSKNAQGKKTLEISLTNPPEGLQRLPDLIAMLAEGTRFPDIRQHIKSVMEGGDGVEAVWERALEEEKQYGSYSQFGPNVNFTNVLPSYYLRGWEPRYAGGEADFRLPAWKQRPAAD